MVGLTRDSSAIGATLAGGPAGVGFGTAGGLVTTFWAPRDSRMMRLGLVEEAKVSRLMTGNIQRNSRAEPGWRWLAEFHQRTVAHMCGSKDSEESP